MPFENFGDFSLDITNVAYFSLIILRTVLIFLGGSEYLTLKI
jgi:hypothetical protein